MKMTFLGANHEVTGSRTLVECSGKYVLVDCGMEQGKNFYINAEMPVPASKVDIVLITHAHIDHTGLLPLLYKQGFRGRVYATRETCSLCNIMLRDSAHIQESEADWANRKAQRSGAPEVEPLYSMQDAEEVLRLFRPADYERPFPVEEGIVVNFHDVGHLLGSAAIELQLSENGESRTVLFSGDVGNTDQPILQDPLPVEGAPVLVIEATYGDRLHAKRETDTVSLLAGYIQKTLDRGGNIIIPSFAVGRTQEILYFIREIKEKGMVKGHDGFKVYVDSPLANEATAVFLQCGTECLDPDARAVMQRGENPLVFDGLHTFVTTEESKKLNSDPEPKVIIASSGMCDAGRIRHHLKHNLWREESLILFVGYQSNGTLGRAIYEGAKKVKLFGEDVQVNAEVALLAGVSGHADQNGLLRWVENMKNKPELVLVNHSEDAACAAFVDQLIRKGLHAEAPYSGSVLDLISNTWEYQAQPKVFVSEKQKKETRNQKRAYERLVSLAKRLLTLAQESRGRSSRDLARFADAVETLLNRWTK
ncbi:MAG: MBL fold metallo-hydrolase [Clostridia bacterium]|nr:MBL fold metallo-hydrolase [Clostridia bacterium]